MNWISVEEKLPKAKEDVLFVARFGQPDGEPLIAFGYKETDDEDDRLWYDRTETDPHGELIDVYDVTHWMPLPALPVGC